MWKASAGLANGGGRGEDSAFVKELIEKILLSWKMFKAIALMVLRIRVYRRKLMFVVSLAAMLMAFAGMVLLDGFLTEHPLLFAVYWLVASALVFLMMLLAIYDVMMLRSDQSARVNQELSRILNEVEKVKGEETKE